MVLPSPELREVLVAEAKMYGSEIPPITSDPPEHKPYRRLILPFFSPHAVAERIPYTRELCNRLVDGFIAEGRADAAVDYAQQITPRVIAHVLGIDPGRADEFVTWVRGLIELGQTQPQMRIKYRGIMRDFFQDMVTERRARPRDDAISTLLQAEIEGEKLRVWFDRIAEFELADPDGVTWAGGQVRGPRTVPVRFTAAYRNG